MRNLKKFLALVLAMMMVFSLMITANAATVTVAEYQDAYKQLAHYGVFQGGTNGQEDITGKYTRAQMSTVVYRLMTGDETGAGAIPYADYAAERFDDVNADDWFAPYVGWAANANVVIGYPNGNFGPNNNVTGFETALMLLRTLGRDYYREYTDAKDWKLEVGSSARQLGILQNADVGQLTGDANRGLAAYLVNNAVKYPYIVEHAGNGTYTSTNKHLISVIGIEDSTSMWGVESTTTYYSFNWPNQPVTNSYEIEDEPLYEFFTPMTECDLADELKITKNTSYKTFTNGYGNEGSQLIQPLDTINTVGAQGRWTRVYSDRIVYMDTVLARVIDTTPATYDSGNHLYKAASATVVIYANTAFQGVVKDPYGNAPGSGAGWQSAITPDTAGSPTYEVEGSFTVGQFITANILTGTGNNSLNGGSGPVNPDTDWPYTSSAMPARLQNAVVANPTEVVIDAITYEGVTTNRAVGFKGTNGQQYLYDVTYGYNSGSSVTTLGTPDLNKTFRVYTDGRNNVLGVVPVSVTGGVGVVTKATAVQLDSATVSGFNYAIKFTILKPDNTYVEITGRPTASTFWNTTDIASALGYVRQLVTYVYAGSGDYYIVTPATANLVNNGGTNSNTVLAGVADTLAGPTGPIMDDDTVIFVANYAMNNSLASSPTRGAFATNGYTIYYGIKDLPNDLAAATAPAELYDNGVQLTSANDNGMNPNQVYYYTVGTSATGTASYVLVVHGANATPISKRAVTVPTYAYMQHDLLQNNVYDGYYVFNVLQNGYANTLRLNNSAGATVSTNGSGLYVVTPDSTNGTYSIEGDNVVNYLGTVSGASRTALTGWSYDAGVLKLGSALNINNYNGDNNTNKKYAANPLTGNNNVSYLTVADDAQIFIVNPKTGNSVPAIGYTLGTIAKIYGDAANSWSATTRPVDIYFQTNEYGWINLVYVVDNTVATGGSAPSTTDVTFVLNIVNKDTGVAYQTYPDWTNVPDTYTSLTGLLNTVATNVGVSTTNLKQYGAIFVNGSPLTNADLPFTTVAGKTYTIVINAYYTNT